MMSYEEFTQKEAALESAPRGRARGVLCGDPGKGDRQNRCTDDGLFPCGAAHYREGDFRAAREILEPFVIDYQSYAYRPEIIACFNLMGVAVYCERSYALARFYIHEGLKIARENHETSRYSYEYNNLAVTYLAQHEYEKALEAIREAERHLPDSDREMHAYIYRNLSEICCHLDRLDEAQAALTRCVEEYDGRTLLPDDILLVEMLLYYKLGDAERYEKCRAEVWQKLPAMHAAEFGNTANNLFACEMDAGNYPQVERILRPWTTTWSATRAKARSPTTRLRRHLPGHFDGSDDAGHGRLRRHPRHPQFRPPRCGDHPHHCHECQRLCRGCAEMPGHRHERPHQQAAV